MPRPACNRCDSAPARPGRKSCVACGLQASAEQCRRKARYRRLGLCVHCGGGRDRPPLVSCSECLRQASERWARYYADPAVRERKRRYNRRRYWENKAARAERLAAKQRRTA